MALFLDCSLRDAKMACIKAAVCHYLATSEDFLFFVEHFILFLLVVLLEGFSGLV